MYKHVKVHMLIHLKQKQTSSFSDVRSIKTPLNHVKLLIKTWVNDKEAVDWENTFENLPSRKYVSR